MTSEKELRKIAREEVTRAVFHHTPLWEDYPNLAEDEWVRVVDLISDWPIPDLPPADHDGCWWPKHGRNYGHVRGWDCREMYDSDPVPGVVIARGGSGEASRYTSISLTLDEAEELASLLLAAAHHERNQE
ncbi:MAG: hypothetical protein ACI38U_03290 [Corynebacterium sp.]|uniref:hypothetical protein n=1 Tax=Corynebacterium sp. TaxID=1720 RepID=UPI003F0821B6